MDVLSSVVFASLLKSALFSYGIDEPEAFLGTLKGELLTLRLGQSGERTMMMAGVHDEEALRPILKNRFGPNLRSVRVGDADVLEDPKGTLAFSLNKDFVVLGSPSDVSRYFEDAKQNGTTMKDEHLPRMTFFVPTSSSANIVTYTDDSDRIGNFISAILIAKGVQTLGSGQIEAMVAELPYSATETTLGERGFDRVTKSPLGQFSALLPLLIPDKPRPTKTSN